MQFFDKSFVKSPQSYIYQSLLAAATVLVILTFVEVLTHAVIIAALGSSAFTVFAMPDNITAQPRRLIGGHIVGILCGLVSYYALMRGALGGLFGGTEFICWVAAALAVGLSIFIMTITNTEHPPASATALGIVVHEQSYQVVLFVLLCVIFLAIIGRIFRGRIKNLF